MKWHAPSECLHLQGGQTVVHVCAALGYKEVLELLIDKCNLSATDKDDVSYASLWRIWSSKK